MTLGSRSSGGRRRRSALDGRFLPGPVHACPPEGAALTPCCSRTLFDLPRRDRVKTDPSAVTCEGRPVPAAPPAPTS